MASENKGIQSFGLADVAITSGYIAELREINTKVINSMTADTVLYAFRYNANTNYNASFDLTDTPFGGWAAPGHVYAGHFEGHYMSAASMLYAGNHDLQLKEKIIAIVDGLEEVQKAMRTKEEGSPVGYLSGFPETRFDVLESGTPTKVPWYMIHKIMQGLLDIYKYVGYPKALSVAENLANWVNWRTGRLTAEHMQNVLKTDEYGGMQDVLANMYQVTENPLYLEISERFTQKELLLTPLYEGKDNLTKLHGNTYLAKIVSCITAYEATKNEYYRTVAEKFWDKVIDGRTYITGGNSRDEKFTEPHKIADSLTGKTCETCNIYNMLKISRALFSYTGDVKYADYYEWALFNQIFASINKENGDKTYYQYMAPKVKKDFRSNRTGNYCCNGTGLESFTKLQDSIYFHTDNELYVNLFINSKLNWEDRAFALEQVTDFPVKNTSTLKILRAGKEPIAIKLRVPHWCHQNITVKVNDEALTLSATDRYITVEREWKAGDTVTIIMDMQFEVFPTTDNKNVFAITYGPIVMAAVDCDGLNGHIKGSDTDAAIKFIRDNLKIDSVERLSALLTTEYGTEIKFLPYYKIQNEVHSVYWTLVCK